MFSFILKTSYETFRSFVISAQISRKADLKQIYYNPFLNTFFFFFVSISFNGTYQIVLKYTHHRWFPRPNHPHTVWQGRSSLVPGYSDHSRIGTQSRCILGKTSLNKSHWMGIFETFVQKLTVQNVAVI